MLGPDGQVLYVGKSIRLRTRLLSYFRAEPGEKASRILDLTRSVDWEPLPNEFAALLREMHLIRRLRPLYNVEHNRTPGFSFVKITGGAAPRLVTCSTVRPDGAEYFGPFRGRKRVRAAVRELANVLQLRDCPAGTPMRFADQGRLFDDDDVPGCVRAELRTCLAPCARGCSRADYLEKVDAARAFLRGRNYGPLRTLERRMHAAAERLQFEHAALLRTRVERLRSVQQQLMILKREVSSVSVLYTVPGFEGDDRVYLIRRGEVAAELPRPRTAAERRRLEARVRELRRGPATPPHARDPERLLELLLVLRWFRTHPEERQRAVPLERAA